MIDQENRQNMYYCFGLAALCILVVVLMEYVVVPRIKTDLPRISKMTGSTVGGKVQKRDPFQSTLDDIRKPDGIHQGVATPKPVSRNPFLWPGEMRPQKENTPIKEVKTKQLPRLGMIIVGQDRSLAFLNETLVNKGDVYKHDQYGEFKVEEIAPKAITLSDKYGKWQLISPEDHFGPAEVKVLKGTDIEN